MKSFYVSASDSYISNVAKTPIKPSLYISICFVCSIINFMVHNGFCDCKWLECKDYDKTSYLPMLVLLWLHIALHVYKCTLYL